MTTADQYEIRLFKFHFKVLIILNTIKKNSAKYHKISMSRFWEIVFCIPLFFRRYVFNTRRHASYRWPPAKLCSATLNNLFYTDLSILHRIFGWWRWRLVVVFMAQNKWRHIRGYVFCSASNLNFPDSRTVSLRMVNIPCLVYAYYAMNKQYTKKYKNQLYCHCFLKHQTLPLAS